MWTRRFCRLSQGLCLSLFWLALSRFTVSTIFPWESGFRNLEKSKPSVQPPGSFGTLFCWKASWLQALQSPLDFWWAQFWQSSCSLECFSSIKMKIGCVFRKYVYLCIKEIKIVVSNLKLNIYGNKFSHLH